MCRREAAFWWENVPPRSGVLVRKCAAAKRWLWGEMCLRKAAVLGRKCASVGIYYIMDFTLLGYSNIIKNSEFEGNEHISLFGYPNIITNSELKGNEHISLCSGNQALEKPQWPLGGTPNEFFVGQCDQYFLRYLTLKFENPKKTPFFALFGPFLAGNLW